MQQALGGFRLMAPAAEQQEAAAMLAEFGAQAPLPSRAPAGSPARTLGALLLAFWLGPAGGWLAAKRGRRLSDD